MENKKESKDVVEKHKHNFVIEQYNMIERCKENCTNNDSICITDFAHCEYCDDEITKYCVDLISAGLSVSADGMPPF
jgi:hypothetical protein